MKRSLNKSNNEIVVTFFQKFPLEIRTLTWTGKTLENGTVLSAEHYLPEKLKLINSKFFYTDQDEYINIDNILYYTIRVYSYETAAAAEPP